MNPKVQSFAELATTTSKQLTSSYTEWTNFLRVAGRLYKYPYHELLLIYAQRPEATACASFDIWNKHMNRAVRRGSKGIALMDTSSGEPKLRYVFDISDTVGRDKSRRPFLWQYRDEHSEVVTASLAEHFGVDDEHDLPYQLDVIADDLAAAYWDDYREDILASVPDSYLEELDEFNIEVAFRNAAGASTAYVLLSRCGLDPEDYFSHEDFMSVFDFNTPDAATALGTAVSENSEQVLRQIEVTIKNFERQRRAERGMQHGEQTELPAGRGLPAARIDLGELSTPGQVRTDEGAVSEGGPPGVVQPPAPERETVTAPIGDRPDSEPPVGGTDAAVEEVHGDNGADESVRPDEMGGADEQLQVQGGGDDRERIDLQLEPETPAPAIDFGAVGPTGLKFSHRERAPSTIPLYSSSAEKEQIMRDSDALKNSHGEVAAFFSDNADAGKRADFIKVFFNNTYTEMILDNRQRAGYVAYDDVLHLWRGAYLSRDQEEYLGWDAVADMISRMMERGQWMEQTVLGVDEPTPEQITIQIDEPAPPEDDHIPNLFDIAGSIPLTNSPAREPVTIKPLVSQDVIDAALTLGANERDSRLRIIAEFMKDKPLEKNTRFLQAHYKENGAGFFVGERKYSLWYDDAGLRIAPGESAKSFTATALDWEQAAVRIRELLDEGKYSSQSMLYHAWPYERQRVADALLLLFRDIDPDYRKEKMPRLEDIQSLRVGYPDMLDLSGGDKEIRTTEGKKIVAGENEVLIAGKFSPNITLTAAQEKQVSGITVKYENFGATLDKKGEEKSFEYVTLQAAEEEINHLKNSGGICGAVHISYTLAAKSGRSTCNYTQYLTEQEPDPTPVPAPPVNQGGTSSTPTATPRPTATPTPKVTPTPKPTATPSPLPSLAPVTTPAPTPVTDAQLAIACTSDKEKQAFSFEISGTKADGGTYRKDFKTDVDGKLMTTVPAGKYTVTPKTVKGFDLPEPQNIELTGGSSAYLTFEYAANQRDLTLTVLDDDGQPVPGVTVGLFEPSEVSVPDVAKNTESDSTDISRTMADIKNQKEADEKLRDPYTKANALYVGKTGEDGDAIIQKVPVSELVAVPIDFPDGYAAEKIPTKIGAGLHEKYTLSCKYVTVDLTVHSNATDSAVVGAEVTLLDGSGDELATWTTERTAHRLIRVPEGIIPCKSRRMGRRIR